MTCKRCGITTPRLTVTQRYCPQCARDVERLTATPKRPAWFARLTPKDMTR